jgi:hypothetical protein
METKIVIFLAFTSATLIFNSVIIWLAYKAYASGTAKMTQLIQEFESSESTRALVNSAEAASVQAVEVTEVLKDQLARFEPVLARAQSKYEFRLAQVDVQLEKGIATVLRETEKVQAALVHPAGRLRSMGATLSGVQQVIQYLSGELNGGDASSRPKQ